MGNLIYHDMIDTVRTPDLLDNDYEKDCRYVGAANLMLSVVLGEIPVLSQTQAFDSSVILATLQSESETAAFLSLVRRGFVRIKLFNQPNLLSAFKNAIKNEKFIFSGWPEVQKGLVERQAIEAYIDQDFSTGLPESVLSKLSSIVELNTAINESPIKEPAVVTDISLKSLINEIQNIISSELKPIFKDLNALNTNDRSIHYDHLDLMKANIFERQIAKEIVNMCYNKVIATSLGANYLTLTAKKLQAVTPVQNLLEQELYSRDVFTAEELEGLTKLGWKEVEEFVTKNKDYDQNDILREAKVSKFLATIHSPNKGLALQPKLAGKLFDCTLAATSALVGFFYPVALPVAAAGIYAALFSDVGNKVEQNLNERQLDKFDIFYKGILQRKKDQ